jgi:PAS domain-containing protein
MNLLLIEITSEQVLYVASGAIGAVITIGAFAAAFQKIRSGIWNPFSKGWLAPRRANRLKLKAAADGYDEQVATLKRIEAELTTNGGKSIKDTINRIDRKTEHLQARARHHDNSSDRLIFELDPYGGIVFANAALCDVLEIDEKDLMHRDWVARVIEGQRQFVLRELETAIKNKMPLNFVARFIVENKHVTLRIDAQPYVRSGGELVGFFGSAVQLTA